jgi:hypothetical protein
MTSIGTDNPVLSFKSGMSSDCYSLVALSQMHGAGNEASHVDLHDLVLSESDLNHLPEPIHKCGRRKRRRNLARRLE